LFSESIVLEVPSFDGTLKWKIDDFKRVMDKALGGSTTEFYSPIFYLQGNNGYKMRLRLSPNGLNGGKNSHMSLFLLILKGDCDDGLAWPLKIKLQLSLMNTARGVHTTGQVTSGPFKKPMRNSEFDGDEAGFYQFIPIKYVPSYVKDDMIFIKCDATLA
jgi:TNF receptor-associated factor 2